MPRLGLRKLREQTHALDASRRTVRLHLSQLLTVDDHAVRLAFDHGMTLAGRRSGTFNRPALARITRALTGDTPKRRRKVARVEAYNARRPHQRTAKRRRAEAKNSRRR